MSFPATPCWLRDLPAGTPVGMVEQSLPCASSVLVDALACLDAEERNRADRFLFEADRQRFMIGRQLVKAAAARIHGCRAADVSVRLSASGAPFLEAGPHVSIAHAGDRIIAAFCASAPVGVDVERGRDAVPTGLPGAIFDALELAEYRGTPAHGRPAFFYRAWTRKEAVLKALGQGFGRDPRGVNVLDDEWAIDAIDGRSGPLRSHVEGGYHYALALLSSRNGASVASDRC